MNPVIAAAASSAVLVAAGSAAFVRPARTHASQAPLVAAVTPPQPSEGRPAHLHAPITPRRPAVSNEALTAVVKATCATCHSERQKSGNLVLANFDVANAASTPETAEKMIGKLRAGMMPPPGRKRPGGDTLVALAETLERLVDRAASAKPEPGTRSFQRLNRAEYERSIRDLLTLDVYRTITLRTLGIAALVTVVDALLALPVAFYMAKVASPRRCRDAVPCRRPASPGSALEP